ncbi:hypothetical protein JEP72_19435, partial [Proteus mirabilis]|nr:hypothetical protein [Proteus mirabilis]
GHLNTCITALGIYNKCNGEIFGRMVSRYEKGSSSGQRYHYDSDHRIIAVDIDQGPLGY